MENPRYALANTVMMVRPVSFDLNEETADSNAFQIKERSESAIEIRTRAIAEFEAMVTQLRDMGINVIVFDDTPEPHTPDSVFPNNWVSFHADGTVVLYPMQAKSRRLERRADFIEALQKEYHFDVSCKIDLSPNEAKDVFLEGTGSMVLDGGKPIVYACLSSRTQADLLKRWCNLLNYRAITFDALDKNGKAIYHTNVMMCLGRNFAVAYLDAIPNPEQRSQFVAQLEKDGHQIVAIGLEQMNRFAGNMLQLQNEMGETVLVMSKQARNALNDSQLDILQSLNNHIVSPDVSTIERYGGGSVRCMMAEVFLPRKPENGERI